MSKLKEQRFYFDSDCGLYIIVYAKTEEEAIKKYKKNFDNTPEIVYNVID